MLKFTKFKILLLRKFIKFVSCLFFICGIVLGVNFKDLIPKTPVKLEDLGGKVIAIDAYNAIYQFLSLNLTAHRSKTAREKSPAT
jgi:hypothetical protein